MRSLRHDLVRGTMVMVCALAMSAGAQTAATPSNPPAQSQAPAGSAPAPAVNAPQPSAKQQFPFPEDDSKTAQPGVVPDAPGAAVPDAPRADAPAAKDAVKKYPFPTDNPEAPADNTAPSPTPAGGGYSSSKDNEPVTEPAATGARKLELRDLGSDGHVDTARAEKDMQVADFYIKDGNYQGAYLRYKDAVAFAPDDAEAHFRLAEMARKQGKKAEAVSEYATCLKLDAQGKRAKEARKALEELKAAAAAPASAVPALAPTGPK